MTVTEWLAGIQGDKSQAEFAKEIAISQSYISRIYRGERNFGPKLARKLKAAYPHLALEIAAFLLPTDIPKHHGKAA